MQESKRSKNIIVVKSSGGFGNQFFYIIFSLYLSQKYKVKIKLCTTDSFHSKNETHSVMDVFDQLGKYIEVIDLKEMHRIESAFKATPITSAHLDLVSLPSELNRPLIFHANPFAYCHFMYESLSSSYKSSLRINTNLISAETLRLASTPYIAVNIRYGEKLCYAIQDGRFFNAADQAMHHKYVLYSPSYYKDIIKTLHHAFGYPVYIITDSPSLVETFVLNEGKTIATIIDTPYLEDFYLLTYAQVVVASHSTFSFSACYLNQNDRVYLLKKPESELANYVLPEDHAISPNWTVSDNPKYILNTNQALVVEMVNHYGRCEYFKQWYLDQGADYAHIKDLFE